MPYLRAFIRHASRELILFWQDAREIFALMIEVDRCQRVVMANAVRETFDDLRAMLKFGRPS